MEGHFWRQQPLSVQSNFENLDLIFRRFGNCDKKSFWDFLGIHDERLAIEAGEDDHDLKFRFEISDLRLAGSAAFNRKPKIQSRKSLNMAPATAE